MSDSKFIEGCLIIQKHSPNKDGFNLHAEHDQFFFGGFDWIPDGKDKEKLIELGWFENEDSWSWFT